MTIIRNSFEGGTDGVTVSVANSGGASGTAWSTVNLNGGDIEYDNAQAAHGTISALVQPASGAVTELRMDVTGDTTAMVSFYFRTASAPSILSTLCQLRNSTSSAALIRWDSATHRFVVQNAAGSTLFSSSAISTGTWYRLELRVVRGSSTSNGTIEFAYYVGDSLTPVQTYSSSAVNAGTTDVNNVRLGRPSAATTDTTTFWLDSIQILTGSDAAALGVPWAPEKINPTATRVSNTEVEVAWTHPADAPDGVTIARGSGLLPAVDGNGLPKEDPAYDFLSIAGVSVITTGETTSPYSDTGLGGGDYFYDIARTVP